MDVGAEEEFCCRVEIEARNEILIEKWDKTTKVLLAVQITWKSNE
jgi:hypothetical protein